MITFTVTPDDDDEYEVTGESRDVLVWEKTSKGKTMESLETPAMADMYRIAHIVSRRKGLFNGGLDEFEKTVNLDVKLNDEEPDPTPPAA